jgi:hypothetical protein
MKGIIECDNKVNIKAEYGIEKFEGPGHHGNSDGTAFSAPHQKLKVGRKIYFVDSDHNEVKVFDIDTKKLVDRKTFEGITWINTLNCIDGHLYIVAHNMGRPSALIKTDLDLNVVEIIEDIGFAAHNVWSMNGDLWTCDSASGCLSLIGGTQQIDIGEFPRGVAMSEDYLIVGITKQRYSTTPYPVKRHREINNCVSNGGLAIIDRASLEVVKYVDLRDLTGKTSTSVFDIRLMDERDHASHLDDDNSFLSLDLLHE